jgi:hypothetical protein
MWIGAALAIHTLFSALSLEEDEIGVRLPAAPTPEITPRGNVIFPTISPSAVMATLREFHEAPEPNRKRYPLYAIILSADSDKIGRSSRLRNDLRNLGGEDVCFLYFFDSAVTAVADGLPFSEHAAAASALSRGLRLGEEDLPGIFLYDDSSVIFTNSSKRQQHTVYIGIRDLDNKTVLSRMRYILDIYRKSYSISSVTNEINRERRRRLVAKVSRTGWTVVKEGTGLVSKVAGFFRPSGS